MTPYTEVAEGLSRAPLRWLVTGAAGFIGSHLVERLLQLGQHVVGLDNFSTGHRANIDAVLSAADSESATRFEMIEADVADLTACQSACSNVDVVLHQAALGSVPRSIENPLATNRSNVTGFLNMLVAARDQGVSRFVYAASSSTYGDHPALPKVEDRIGKPLSPYAVTKYVNELYANVFHSAYGIEVVGLRYFNVFGPRQDPNGAYAAVIPKWVANLLNGVECRIYGDGETSRDFCYIENVIQANVLAAITPAASGEVFNIACGDRTSLSELFQIIRDGLAVHEPAIASSTPTYCDFRPGDVRHSLADVSKARGLLGYQPLYSVRQGMNLALRWYVDSARTGQLQSKAAGQTGQEIPQ